MEWKTPEHLYTCVAKYDPERAQALTKLYDNGSALPAEMDAIQCDHLAYLYELGEKGILFAGGPLGGFGDDLSIYAVNSEEEAKKAKRNDPYYIKGYFHDDRYVEWCVHQPLAIASPGHKQALEQGLREAGVTLSPKKIAVTAPDRLFVCFSTQDAEHSKRLATIYDGKSGAPMPPEVQQIRYAHLKYGYEMGEKGAIWAAGPLANHTGGMSIYAVNSLEEARKIKEGDPYHKVGFLYECQYQEWFIHMPYGKLSSGHRNRIKQDLIRYGIVKP